MPSVLRLFLQFPDFVEAVDGPEAAKSAAFEATRSPSQTSMRQQGDQEQQSLAVALFEQVDRDGSGLISFDEFVDWWAQRQLSTGHTLDKILAEKIQKQWNELDRDGSGDLDKNEFESLMAELSTSEWKEAFDHKKQKAYYYNTRTKETCWRQPDAQAAIAGFMATNGLDAPTKPLGLSKLRPPIRGGHADTNVAATTTVNPLAPLPGLDTFDVETPPPLDTLKRRSDRSRAKMRAAGHAAGTATRHSAGQAVGRYSAPSQRTTEARPRRALPPLPPGSADS